MSRPALLSETDCQRVVTLRTRRHRPLSVPTLSKRFKVSESSIYKVLDGTYKARPKEKVYSKKCGTRAPVIQEEFPRVPAEVPNTPTPSIFTNPRPEQPLPSPQSAGELSAWLAQAAKADLHLPVDDVTLAAAELVVAKARFSRALENQGKTGE